VKHFLLSKLTFIFTCIKILNIKILFQPKASFVSKVASAVVSKKTPAGQSSKIAAAIKPKATPAPATNSAPSGLSSLCAYSSGSDSD